jgi:hypothetical protein
MDIKLLVLKNPTKILKDPLHITYLQLPHLIKNESLIRDSLEPYHNSPFSRCLLSLCRRDMRVRGGVVP